MKSGNGLNRRDFIKLSSMALGGIVLTGCGASNGTTQFPNGYRFYRVKSPVDRIDPQGSSFQAVDLLGSAYISADGIVSFDAVDGNKRRGIFQLGVDFSGSRPTIAWERSALLTGDRLVDQRVVSTWGNYDVDEAGNIAALIDADHGQSSADHFGTGLYLDEGQAGFRPVLVAGQAFGGGEIRSSGIFYCVSIRNNTMIAALNHLPCEGYRSAPTDSLLHIPDGDLTAAGRLLSRGDYLAGTDYRARSFGLLDHNDSGDFCATVFAAAPSPETTASGLPTESKASFNLTAQIAAPGDHQLLTCSSQAGVDGALAYGEAGYAPRIGPDGVTYVPLRVDGRIALVRNDQVLLATGDVTEGGTILHIGTGSVGADGHYYYAARTESADWTLFAFDGLRHIPLLAGGDVLSDGGAPVSRILFGTTKRHVDDEGRLVFCCSFADGSTALVVGLPS